MRPLAWDIESLAVRSKAIHKKKIINKRSESTRYSTRALRYWWLYSALNDEIDRKGELTVADFGCSKGHFKQFFGESSALQWIGFDWEIDEPHLQSLGYDSAVQCDFDQEIPYPSNSADVVIFSHVIEHLPRPEFTISEIARVLRPGGVLLAGSPVVPFPFSRLRDWRHQSKHRRGEIKKGGHINSMDGIRWKNLLEACGLNGEMMHGAFLFRWSGNPLENYRWWMRLNNLWGILFPSWGGEIYLSARKQTTSKCPEDVS